MDVNPKIGGVPPKMDGENNGKPYERMDDLGVPLFLETPIEYKNLLKLSQFAKAFSDWMRQSTWNQMRRMYGRCTFIVSCINPHFSNMEPENHPFKRNCIFLS